ncbi:MAG: FecR domain-containing protein [Deltaproteobacteria bacterium]|nr:FecR domain-containing protein [Deltaproteobacteria bacterium]
MSAKSALAALILSLLFVPAAASAQQLVVNSVEGSATATPKGQGPALLIKAGSVLHRGDTVETYDGSKLEVKLATGTVVRLGPNTKIAVDELGGEGGRFHARLFVGNVWAKVAKLFGKQHFELEAENAVAGVRGTEFTVGTGASGSSVRVLEGVVEVKDAKSGWLHRVEPGHELNFRRGEKPLPPRVFDVALATGDPLLRWAKEKPVKLKEPPKEEKPKDDKLEPKPAPEDKKKDDQPPPKADDKKTSAETPHVWDPHQGSALPARPEVNPPASPAELAKDASGTGGADKSDRAADRADQKAERKQRVHERERVHRGQKGQ